MYNSIVTYIHSNEYALYSYIYIYYYYYSHIPTMGFHIATLWWKASTNHGIPIFFHQKSRLQVFVPPILQLCLCCRQLLTSPKRLRAKKGVIVQRCSEHLPGD